MLLSINSFGPFQSDIWGTVSDWAMVFVTGGTGLLILFTLKSQLRVQKSQQNIEEIEILRYREEVKPKISVKLTPGAVTSIENNEQVFFRPFAFTLNNQYAFSFEISLLKISDGYKNTMDLPLKFDKLIPSQTFYLFTTYKSNIINTDLNSYNFFISLKMSYFDIKGNEYEQYMTYAFTYGDIFDVSEPILVKAVDINNL